ncbi:Protein CBG27738 [Caenorhabditis briggsae]|uniref:Protein CBG27738 n=1 Tax=Caenorhabditis briggsae TaxID=6238 RepID=B6IJ36_CAEBR|nr:Protein CBG27738 [Caenorhabditis briggsae]CAS00016.1 Protein CBG27738 [Caenorhabditis briggsae]
MSCHWYIEVSHKRSNHQ